MTRKRFGDLAFEMFLNPNLSTAYAKNDVSLRGLEGIRHHVVIIRLATTQLDHRTGIGILTVVIIVSKA